jgi:hypothetical protein
VENAFATRLVHPSFYASFYAAPVVTTPRPADVRMNSSILACTFSKPWAPMVRASLVSCFFASARPRAGDVMHDPTDGVLPS